MEPWFVRYPGRLQKELQALQDAGYSAIVDEEARKIGRLIITVKYSLNDVTHDLVATFPDSYPYFPFEITSLTFPGGRHKNAYNNALCLLKDPQTKWSAGTDTLAGIIGTQIPKLIHATQNSGSAHDVEAHEAVQVSGQLVYEPIANIFIGSWGIPMGCKKGSLLIGIDQHIDPNQFFRGAILEVLDLENTQLATIDDELRVRYKNTIKGRWVKLATAPSSTEAPAIFEEAAKIWPELKTPNFKHGPDVVGITFPEEVEHNKFHDAWVFIVRTKLSAKNGKISFKYHLVRADQVSREIAHARIPKLTPLTEKKILVVGLGSIGSVFSWQMARAGIGELRLLDFDTLQFGNAPRWMYGISSAGHLKSHFLAGQLHHEFPFVKTSFQNSYIGIPVNKDYEVILNQIDGVDLIVDATAEFCVSYFLSDIAKERGISYLWATGTPGGWGGTIGRIVPGQTQGCWRCFQQFMTDETIKTPNFEELPFVQPAGCFHPTFTGTGFDMDQITNQAVRLAVSTLCKGQDGAYPDFSWDIGIVNSFNKNGLPITPEWYTQKLEHHPNCDCHE